MFEYLSLLLSPYYYNILVIVAAYFFIFSFVNHYEMRRFTLEPEIFNGPFVSVLIPMRNEEKNAEKCLKHLRNQNYENYEILVINDNSTDNTLNILERMAAEDKRIKIFNGKPLPDDWYGKPFALQQLSYNAKGDILIFTDADTVHGPASISWAVTNLLNLKTDMISGYTGQDIKKFGEIITIPLMFCLTGFVIPLFLNRLLKSSLFSIAIGQYIAIKNDVFKTIGGYEAIRKKTSEDICLARYVKQKGYNTFFLDITKHVKCKMYDGYRSAYQGIGKTMYDFFGRNIFLLVIFAIAVFFFIFFPFCLLLGCAVFNSQWALHIIIINILHTLTCIFMLSRQRLNWLYGFLWPLMYLNYLYISFWSWFMTVFGKGFLWKGRKVI